MFGSGFGVGARVDAFAGVLIAERIRSHDWYEVMMLLVYFTMLVEIFITSIMFMMLLSSTRVHEHIRDATSICTILRLQSFGGSLSLLMHAIARHGLSCVTSGSTVHPRRSNVFPTVALSCRAVFRPMEPLMQRASSQVLPRQQNIVEKGPIRATG